MTPLSLLSRTNWCCSVVLMSARCAPIAAHLAAEVFQSLSSSMILNPVSPILVKLSHLSTVVVSVVVSVVVDDVVVDVDVVVVVEVVVVDVVVVVVVVIVSVKFGGYFSHLK